MRMNRHLEAAEAPFTLLHLEAPCNPAQWNAVVRAQAATGTPPRQPLALLELTMSESTAEERLVQLLQQAWARRRG